MEAKPRRPTELELALLKVLWEAAPLSAEQVREALADRQPPRKLAYSSVITVLNILVSKGFARRVKQGRAFVFEPEVTQQEVSRSMASDLVQRVFDGSAAALMVELLDTSDLDAEELRLIQRLISRRKKEVSG